jgi:aryl-alcohol dehydrogenase-like predicted oxidoreductase
MCCAFFHVVHPRRSSSSCRLATASFSSSASAAACSALARFSVPFAYSVGALARLREQGKIKHVGLSNVSAEQLAAARSIVPIASVQNRWSPGDRGPERDGVLAACTAAGIAFLPCYPLRRRERRPLPRRPKEARRRGRARRGAAARRADVPGAPRAAPRGGGRSRGYAADFRGS